MRANIEAPRRAKEIAELRERQEYNERLFDEVKIRSDLTGGSSSSRSGSSSDGKKVGVLLGTLIPGFVLVLVAIFTLNIVVMIVGFILFAIGIGIWSWISGSSHHHDDFPSSFYINRWGSANAKRNMWRGHRYSSPRRKR